MDTTDPVSMRNSVKIWFVIIIIVRKIRVNPEDGMTSDCKTRVENICVDQEKRFLETPWPRGTLTKTQTHKKATS